MPIALTLAGVVIALDVALIVGLVLRNVKLASDVDFWKRRCLNRTPHRN